MLQVKGARHLSVARKAQRKHLQRVVVPGLPMVNRYRSLPSLQSRASRNSATVVIPLQHFLSMTAIVGFVLTLERVAGRAQSFSQHLRAAAGTMHHDLLGFRHLEFTFRHASEELVEQLQYLWLARLQTYLLLSCSGAESCG
jgi:hypothetical protein